MAFACFAPTYVGVYFAEMNTILVCVRTYIPSDLAARKRSVNSIVGTRTSLNSVDPVLEQLVINLAQLVGFQLLRHGGEVVPAGRQ